MSTPQAYVKYYLAQCLRTLHKHRHILYAVSIVTSSTLHDEILIGNFKVAT
jgi:hypothetical protein